MATSRDPGLCLAGSITPTAEPLHPPERGAAQPTPHRDPSAPSVQAAPCPSKPGRCPMPPSARSRSAPQPCWAAPAPADAHPTHSPPRAPAALPAPGAPQHPHGSRCRANAPQRGLWDPHGGHRPPRSSLVPGSTAPCCSHTCSRGGLGTARPGTARHRPAPHGSARLGWHGSARFGSAPLHTSQPSSLSAVPRDQRPAPSPRRAVTQRGGTGVPPPTPPRPPRSLRQPRGHHRRSRHLPSSARPGSARFSSARHGSAQDLAARLGTSQPGSAQSGIPGPAAAPRPPSETLRDLCGGCGATALGHGTCPVRLGPAQPASTGLRAPGCVPPPGRHRHHDGLGDLGWGQPGVPCPAALQLRAGGHPAAARGRRSRSQEAARLTANGIKK